MLRTTIAAILVVVVTGITGSRVLGQDCMHPGPNADGSIGWVAGPCPQLGPISAPLVIPVSLSELQATFDLDVTYIERTPRYPSYCAQGLGCPGHVWCNQVYNQVGGAPCEPTVPTGGGACQGLVNGKRWPDAGDTVTYTAHIRNKGGQIGSGYSYAWKENGVAVPAGQGGTGTRGAISPGQEHTITLQRTWSSTPGTVEIAITPTQLDLFASNNKQTIHTHALALKYFVAQSIYDQFNARQSAFTGTFSFEDWAQKHISLMNDLFAQSVYDVVAPNGILDRVRIDRFQVYTGNPEITEQPQNDPHFYCMDGKWNTTSATNINIIDEIPHWGLIHELGHQLLWLIDGYAMNLPGFPPGSNFGLQITPFVQVLAEACNAPPPRSHPPLCPTVWEGVTGIMDGGDTYPNTAPFPTSTEGLWDRHTAAGMNRDYLKRRGYYYQSYLGAYIWDTPSVNYLRVLDDSGDPIGGAQVKMYQKRTLGTMFDSEGRCLDCEFTDNTAEIQGTTDANGVLSLPNRSVGETITVPTGHTMQNNPFGAIFFIGNNGTFLVRITKGSNEWFRWLTIEDLNLAYWMGNSDLAVHTVGPCTFGVNSLDPDMDQDEVRDLCDNCRRVYNPSQRDSNHDGEGDACCTGDCNGDGNVFGTEITKVVSIMGGDQPLSLCPAGDPNADGNVTCSEVTRAVRNLGLGCNAPAATPPPATSVAMVTLDVGEVQGAVGQFVAVPVTISGGGGAAATAQLDILFETAALEIADPSTACVSGAAVTAASTFGAKLVSTPPPPNGFQRLRLYAYDSSVPISTLGDGLFATCSFQITSSAPVGTYVLDAQAEEVSSVVSEVLPSAAVDGSVAVSACVGCGCPPPGAMGMAAGLDGALGGSTIWLSASEVQWRAKLDTKKGRVIVDLRGLDQGEGEGGVVSLERPLASLAGTDLVITWEVRGKHMIGRVTSLSGELLAEFEGVTDGLGASGRVETAVGEVSDWMWLTSAN